MSKIEIIGKATIEQIAIWKKQFGDVFEITVDEHVCYIRPVDRATMRFALSKINVKIDKGNNQEINLEKMIEIGEVILTNCWLGGSEEIKQKDRLLIAASMQAGELFEIAETSLKKL